MKYRTRIYYTDEQISLMWDRWQKGESIHSFAHYLREGMAPLLVLSLEQGNTMKVESVFKFHHII
jgi:hypothetical protein